MPLPNLCKGWPDDTFRPQCCNEEHLRQPTRRRLRKMKIWTATRLLVYIPIRWFMLLSETSVFCTQGNEKYDQSCKTEESCKVSCNVCATIEQQSIEDTLETQQLDTTLALATNTKQATTKKESTVTVKKAHFLMRFQVMWR